MGVKKEELPDGSKLIMGLNPPFGVNAALANRFINKALEFKPKLVILIVPRETQRLDEKEPTYDLIWEDDQMLAGKSFYLPGSIDVNDKQIEDWNNNAPVLYLWSCRAWTPKHKAIAEKHSHQSGALKNYRLDNDKNELHTTNSTQVFNIKTSAVSGEDKHADTTKNRQQKSKETFSHRQAMPCDINSTLKNLEQKKETLSHRDGVPHNINSSLISLEKKEKETISHMDGLPRDINSSAVGKSHAAVKDHSETSPKRFGGKGDRKRPPSNTFLKDKSSSKFAVPRHLSQDATNHSQPYPPEHRETSLQVRSERGDRWRTREVSERGEHQIAQVPCERGDYWQNRQVADWDEHHQVAQVPCERGVGYQQHLSQGSFSAHQSYPQTEDSDGVGDLLKKYGAEDHHHGMGSEQAYDAPHPPQRGRSGGQAYDAPHHPQRGRSGGQAYDTPHPPQRGMNGGQVYETPHPPQHGMRGGQVYGSHHLPQHAMSGGQVYDAHHLPQHGHEWRSNHGYASPAATGPAPPYTSYAGDMNVAVHGRGRVEPNEWNQETAVPPYQVQGRGSSHQYGLAAAATPASSYGEMRTPASQRYAARLHEPIHGRMGPTLPHPPPPHSPNQGPLGFAPGPYFPHHTDSGWLLD